MKKTYMLALTIALSIGVVSTAEARNTRYMLPIKDALNTATADEKLDDSIPLFFGHHSHPRVIQNFDSWVTSRKSNGLGHSDVEACNRAFLSGLIELQKRARKEGGNAVINIISYYDKNPVSSNTEFECHAGAVIAGVALKGDVVKLAGRR